jgi:hypothetical protein
MSSFTLPLEWTSKIHVTSWGILRQCFSTSSLRTAAGSRYTLCQSVNKFRIVRLYFAVAGRITVLHLATFFFLTVTKLFVVEITAN